MGDLHEIVTTEQASRLFVGLAILLPFAGLLLGAVAGARRNDLRRGLLSGLAIGLIGPLNWLMWCIYNLITDRLGLDTLRNFWVNLGLFLLVGVVLGLLIGQFGSRAGTKRVGNPSREDVDD